MKKADFERILLEQGDESFWEKSGYSQDCSELDEFREILCGGLGLTLNDYSSLSAKELRMYEGEGGVEILWVASIEFEDGKYPFFFSQVRGMNVWRFHVELGMTPDTAVIEIADDIVTKLQNLSWLNDEFGGDGTLHAVSVGWDVDDAGNLPKMVSIPANVWSQSEESEDSNQVITDYLKDTFNHDVKGWTQVL